MNKLVERFFMWLEQPGNPFLLAGYAIMASSVLAVLDYLMNGGTP